jgi:hypothetical protein
MGSKRQRIYRLYTEEGLTLRTEAQGTGTAAAHRTGSGSAAGSTLEHGFHGPTTG